jgi:chromosome segregation ATPase
MALAFLKGAFGKKSRDAKVAIIGAAAKVDFDMVKAGQLEEYRAILTDLTNKLGAAQTQLEKEAADVVKVEADYASKLTQAEALVAKAGADGTAPELAAKLEAKAAEFIADAEGMVGDIEQEKLEEAEARADVDELKALVTDMANKIKNAEKAMDKAKANMDRKQRQLSAAEEKAKQAEQLAGLRDAVNGFDTVIGALDDKSAAMDAKINAAKAKAGALKAVTTGADVDPDVQAVLDEANGTAKPEMSLADRLAALKK